MERLLTDVGTYVNKNLDQALGGGLCPENAPVRRTAPYRLHGAKPFWRNLLSGRRGLQHLGSDVRNERVVPHVVRRSPHRPFAVWPPPQAIGRLPAVREPRPMFG